MGESRRVIVVGAGAAGLTAAHALRAAGAEVVVLERDEAPGGRAGVAELRVGAELWRFDRGAAFIPSFYGATRHLARRVGIGRRRGAGSSGPRMMRLDLDSEVIVDRGRHHLPDSARDIVRTPLLSARSKGRAARLATRLSTQGPAWRRLTAAAELDDGDAASYFTHAVGADYADKILPAILGSLGLGPAGGLSRVVAMAQFAAAPGANLYCPYGGLGALWDSVADDLDVRYRTTVVALHAKGDSAVVETADGEALEADAVLVAGPASLAAALLPADHPDRRLAADAVATPSVKLHLALAAPKPRRRPTYASGAGRHSLAGAVPLEVRHTGQVPSGRGSLEISAAPYLAADLLNRPDRLVRTLLLAEAERLLGGPVGDILDWSVVRNADGVPRFGIGWVRRLAARPPLTGRIHAVGDWLDSPSVEGAVRSALRTVPHVIA